MNRPFPHEPAPGDNFLVNAPWNRFEEPGGRFSYWRRTSATPGGAGYVRVPRIVWAIFARRSQTQTYTLR